MSGVRNSKAMHYDVVIVGSGHAGAQAAAMLRQQKFEGSIAIVGEEREEPYERPPLSKEFLLGEKSFERLALKPSTFWADREIHLLLGQKVVGLQTDVHVVITAQGLNLSYGKLVWAAGGAARRLTCRGYDFTGVHAVRTIEDVSAIALRLPFVENIVIIGGGYIGLETAAVFRKLGKSVVVLETQERVLARVAGEPLSRFYEAQHRAHGVDVRLNATVDSIQARDGIVTGVRLAEGDILPAQLVIVGIGIVPSVQLLLDAGADGGNGVQVDEFCRTNIVDVYAIGDCASHKNRYAEGREIRLESVQNANDQAMTVAKVITGNMEPYQAVPWFWSHQYDLHLQTIGLSIGYDDLVVRGEPETKSFSVVYLRQGRVIALDCVNATKDFVQGKALVVAAMKPDRDKLRDPNIALKELI